MCLGLPGRIVEITDPDKKLGAVELDGEIRVVNLACISGSTNHLEELVGAWVMVHLGFAMQRVDEEEARQSRALLEEIQAAMRGGA